MTKEIKINFKKRSTYGDTWDGFVGAMPVFTIKRTFSYGKTGGYVYSLYWFGGNEVLTASCFLNDVTRAARFTDLTERLKKVA